MEETWVWSLGQEDPLEEGMSTYSSILAGRTPWTEEPGGIQSMGSHSRTWLKRVSTHMCTPAYISWGRKNGLQAWPLKLASCLHCLRQEIRGLQVRNLHSASCLLSEMEGTTEAGIKIPALSLVDILREQSCRNREGLNLAWAKDQEITYPCPWGKGISTPVHRGSLGIKIQGMPGHKKSCFSPPRRLCMEIHLFQVDLGKVLRQISLGDGGAVAGGEPNWPVGRQRLRKTIPL